MSDYINRQEAIKAVYAIDTVDTIGLQFDEVVFGMRLDDIVRIVLNAPTVLEAAP